MAGRYIKLFSTCLMIMGSCYGSDGGHWYTFDGLLEKGRTAMNAISSFASHDSVSSTTELICTHKEEIACTSAAIGALAYALTTEYGGFIFDDPTLWFIFVSKS